MPPPGAGGNSRQMIRCLMRATSDGVSWSWRRTKEDRAPLKRGESVPSPLSTTVGILQQSSTLTAGQRRHGRNPERILVIGLEPWNSDPRCGKRERRRSGSPAGPAATTTATGRGRSFPRPLERLPGVCRSIGSGSRFGSVRIESAFVFAVALRKTPSRSASGGNGRIVVRNFRLEDQRPPNDVLTFASRASPATPPNHWRSDRGFVPESRHVGVRTWMDRSRIRNRTSPLPDQTYEVSPMRLPGAPKLDWIQGEAASASPAAAGGAASGPITSSPAGAFFIAATTPSGVTALSAQ